MSSWQKTPDPDVRGHLKKRFSLVFGRQAGRFRPPGRHGGRAGVDAAQDVCRPAGGLYKGGAE